MRKFVAEFTGTFFLVFIIGMCVHHAQQFAPVAIGVGLAALVYAGYHASGAQYNPAVTIGIWLLRGVSGTVAILYILLQFVAGVLASAAVEWLCGEKLVVAAASDSGFAKAFIAEVLGTFALMYVILETAVNSVAKGNSYYGLAIGLVVSALAYALGPVSGGAFNPAVGLGPAFYAAIRGAGLDAITLLLYSTGPVAGALAAALVYRRGMADSASVS